MFPAYKTILCCHGFGPQAAEVLRHAFGLAQCYDAEVVIVHTLEPPSPQTQQVINTYLPAGKLEDLQKETVTKVIEDIDAHVQEVCGDSGRCRMRQVKVLEGHTADRLLQAAKELGADLIVMGSHRHSTVGELLLGSTAHRVAQNATVPVLLVRLSD